MKSRIFSSLVLATVGGVMLMSAPAEARSRLWWLQSQPEYVDPNYDVYGDITPAEEQNVDVQEQFNQQQYELYLKQMHRKKRVRYDQAYYEPQLDQPAYTKPAKPKVKKPVAKTGVAKPPMVIAKPVVVGSIAAEKPSQVASLSKRFDGKVSVAKVDCSKGLSIVSSYGFSTVTSKKCDGDTLVYNAIRSGQNFEIQVSAASGELTAVKKL
jgi:hypothetical protein